MNFGTRHCRVRTIMVNKLFLFFFYMTALFLDSAYFDRISSEGRYLHIVELLHKYYQEMNDLYVTDVRINSNKMSKSMN